jgi:TatD DNase family protein
MYIDTHCHLLKEDFENIDEVVNKLENNYAIVSGAEIGNNEEVLELVKKYPNIYGTIGLHPSEASKYTDKDILFIEKNLTNEKIVGIGEIGLDYHYGKEDANKQKELFIKQLDLARKYKLHVTIHSRDALLDTYQIIKEYKDLKITYHCYSYSLEHAKELLKLNVKFGIGGVLTFKNSKVLKEVVKEIPLSNLMLETDSPYLAPEPIRGTKNIPSNVKIVAEKIAEIKNVPYEMVLKTTFNNAIYQFDLKI